MTGGPLQIDRRVRGIDFHRHLPQRRYRQFAVHRGTLRNFRHCLSALGGVACCGLGLACRSHRLIGFLCAKRGLLFRLLIDCLIGADLFRFGPENLRCRVGMLTDLIAARNQ